MNYWLLLEKSDETRVSKGIDGYRDSTGESYHYDSLVPNHRNLAAGDLAVLRKESEIIGVGTIGDISETTDAKIHRRCPKCNSTDIRERTTKQPKWKCGKCTDEFSDPKETIVEVRSFVAAIKDFTRLNPPRRSKPSRCARELAMDHLLSYRCSVLTQSKSKLFLKGLIHPHRLEAQLQEQAVKALECPKPNGEPLNSVRCK